MIKKSILTALVFSLLAVILGAFGAHSLEGMISAKYIATWKTAVTYQMWHALAMVLGIYLYERNQNRLHLRANLLFAIGIILFSGSLYFISLKELFGIESVGIFGLLTPIGGLFFIAGWLLHILGILKTKNAR